MEQFSDTRLAKLETQITYNEETIADLNKVVTKQAGDIVKLQKEVEILGRQILELTEGTAA